jgi:hypothetical protein
MIFNWIEPLDKKCFEGIGNYLQESLDREIYNAHVFLDKNNALALILFTSFSF